MKAMQRIGLLLSLVFLMPALFFSVYEISSLNKDEKMIQEIYTQQLDAILFSINQYSDDIFNSWISKVERGIDAVDKKTAEEEINNLLAYNPSLLHIFMADTVSGKPVITIFSLDHSQDKTLTAKIDSALTLRKNQIRQLISYKNNGFQKLDTLNYAWRESRQIQCVIFLSENEQEQMHVIGFIIDPETFIEDLVGPRLQVVARDQFILSAFSKRVEAPIYSTLQSDTIKLDEELLARNFWLFPDYQIGIRTSGATIQNVIRERTSTNLILLVLLDIVLIAAVILVFRNVRKEVRLAQSKSDFVSNVSHEIRTPLALISMFSETLEMGRVPSEEKKKEYYRIISKETQRLTGIVNRILNFSQTEANKKSLHLETLLVNKELKEVLSTYDFHLVNKGFEYKFIESEEIWVKADKEAFVESVINLIDNAVKYSIDTKRIELSVAKENDFGLVKVKDYGVGISSADQKHIFEKFYRVSSGNLAKARGTGLGLSLVQQLMTAQNGKITVSSEPNKGSEFTLYFPLVKL